MRRGADEIWAIWTVSRRDEWRDGFINQYFQIIETVADTNFFTYWKRLEAEQRRIAAGQPGEFGRHIALNLIEAEVPVHYLLNFSKDRMAEAVNAGRRGCSRVVPRAQHPVAGRSRTAPAPACAQLTSLQFTEVMRGYVSAGATATTHAEFEAAAAAGKNTNGALMFELTVTIANVDEFVTSPKHEAKADGFIDSPIVGGRSTVTGGVINLLVDAGEPTRKQMKYRLMFKGADARDYTLVGFKDISGQTFVSAWPETTTLYTTILAGHVAEGQSAQTVASGVLHIRPEDFLFRQLFSFRVQGPTLAARTQALNRFGVMFLGKLWDVYGHQVGPL